MRRLWIALFAVTLLAGCKVGPNFHLPRFNAPRAYASASTVTLTRAPEVEWWKTFHDEKMDALISRAVLANHDLLSAAARVREARALRAEEVSGLLPQVDINGNATRTRISENSADGRSAKAAAVGRNPDLIANDHELGFDASWELDLFGRTRRGIEAAQADLEASVEAQRGVLLSLLGEVARNYVELRGYQKELAITKKNIVSQQESLRITRIRFAAGLTSEADVANARAQLATTQANLPGLQTQIRQTAHRISVLCGEPPEAMLNDLLTTAPIPAALPRVPVGLPGELIRRRPDIRQSEHELAAANARLAQAVADLYPQVKLNASLGLSSTETGDFFRNASHTWSIGPGVSVPVFKGGKLVASIAAANAREEQALLGYQKTVLTALEDVENAMVAYQHEWNHYASLKEAVAANQRAYELSNALYSRGLTAFLSVLDSQRNLYAAEDALTQSERTLSTDIIAIYKALGGGWQNQLPETPAVQNGRVTDIARAPQTARSPARPGAPLSDALHEMDENTRLTQSVMRRN